MVIDDEYMTKRPGILERSRARVARAARLSLAYDGRLTDQTRADVCEQAGVPPSAFRTLFPSDDDLLDRVNELLVQECEMRLRTVVDAFKWNGSESSGLMEAALALARSRPIDRAVLLIRSERRLAALRSRVEAEPVVVAERRFVAALSDVLTDLLSRLGRRFVWRTELAVRVILDTYERSFEAWMLAGHDETDFDSSPFVSRTLPTILASTSTEFRLDAVETL